MKKISQAEIDSRSRAREEERKKRAKEGMRRYYKERAAEKIEARKEIVEELAGGGLTEDGIRLAIDYSLLDEIPSQYLREYADGVMLRNSHPCDVGTQTWGIVSRVYEKLGEAELAKKAAEYESIVRHADWCTASIEAMTR